MPVVHGSVAAAELERFGFTPSTVLDFSVNTNPLGPAPSVLRAVRETDWSRYPGDDERPLRQALADRAGVDPDAVALGNGSAELLWLIALATVRPGDRVVVLTPTFGEYARAARAVGAAVTEHDAPTAPLPPAAEHDAPTAPHTTAAAQGLISLPQARLLFVCNPNNPTGAFRARAAIEQLLAAQPDRLLVLDEAYAAFVQDAWPSAPLLEQFDNLILLRSLTKDHALPGLRLGYLLASPTVARAAEAVRPPWSVNAGALRAGLAALEPVAQDHVARARALVATSRHLLTTGLSRLGYAVAPSAANFVLVEVGDGAAFRRALLPRGLVVRDCASFGLPAHVRIACKLPADCQRLLDAVADLKPA
jgi:histidinol-phosphate aminotransferase